MSASKSQRENLRLDEKNHVEEPLLNQLQSLGWTVIRLEMHQQKPSDSYRNNFGEVILLPQLQQALQKINPFLRDEQINEVVQKITTFSRSTLIENNRYILNLLLENTSVSINHNTQEQSPTVRYIDFNPETFLQNNSFIAISQFKVRIPGTENQCLDAAIQVKITELEVNNPLNINIARLRELETAVVISGNNNDLPHIKTYTNSNYHNISIQRFKLSFNATETAGNTSINGKVGIIIVNNMLLVGFDAPIEQVLYLDRVIRDHNLLQAIARVNRVGEEHKDKGFVVDYVGIGHHLKKALDTYQNKEQQEIISQIRDEQQEINDLILAHREIWNFLEQYNLTDFSDADAFYDLFYDEDIRFAYILAFKKLTKAFNVVMPRKEALDYWQDYKNFIVINSLAYKHFGYARFSLKGIPEKLRNIADEFLKSHGIEQKIAPIYLLDDKFKTFVNSHTRTKTKAATVEHAIRNYINLNLNEDPELFLSFSEKLEQILTEFQDNWERIYEEVEKLRKEIKSKEQENTYGLERKTQMPIFRIFRANLFDNRELNEDEITQNVNLTLHTFNLIKQEIQTAGFWASIPAQNRLKEELQKLFLSPDFVSYPNIVQQRKELISRLLEWSKENHAKLSRE